MERRSGRGSGLAGPLPSPLRREAPTAVEAITLQCDRQAVLFRDVNATLDGPGGTRKQLNAALNIARTNREVVNAHLAFFDQVCEVVRAAYPGLPAAQESAITDFVILIKMHVE